MIDQNSLSRYKEILSIREENIRLKKNPLLTRQAELDFDPSSQSWILYYNITRSEFPFIHELGHIYFASKITDYKYFALPPPPNNRLNRKVGNLIGNLLDCFVNYNLSVFDEIYSIIQQNDFGYLDELGNFQSNVESGNDTNMLLGWYILFYIDFRFILKKKDSNIRKQDIDTFLKVLSSQINRSPEFNGKNIKKFTRSLDRFNEAKAEIKYEKIVYFIYTILLYTNLWTTKELQTQIKLFFPPL